MGLPDERPSAAAIATAFWQQVEADPDFLQRNSQWRVVARAIVVAAVRADAAGDARNLEAEYWAGEWKTPPRPHQIAAREQTALMLHLVSGPMESDDGVQLDP